MSNCDRCTVGLVGRPRGKDKAFRISTEPRRDWEILCGTCVEQVKEQERPWITVESEVRIYRDGYGGEDVMVEDVTEEDISMEIDNE